MICNRQIYNCFSSQKPPNNTRPQKKEGRESQRKKERKKEWSSAKTLESGELHSFWPHRHTRSYTRPRSLTHAHTQEHASLQSRKHHFPSFTLAHRTAESLWGQSCTISLSLSLVVKTVKHMMLSLHAAAPLNPWTPPHQNPTRSAQSIAITTERWGGREDDGPSEWRAGPLVVELELYVQMLVF